MTLTIISILLLAIDFVFFIIFTAIFLWNVKYLFGFNSFKETEATIIVFRRYGRNTADDPISSDPIIKYYNEFLNKTVEKEMTNCGIIHPNEAFTKSEKNRVAFCGEKVKIQYTNKKERVMDPKYTLKNKYNVFRYILPIIITLIISFIAFIMLVISII